jgi:glycosyltransferase involved in cell wall biosynthesis
MKLLIICDMIDLRYRKGITPTSWQLFKALHETGNEVILIPYLGDPIESLWWRVYPNPCSVESKLYFSIVDKRQKQSIGSKGIFSTVSKFLIKNYIRPKWEKHILEVLNQEGDIGAVIFFHIPLSHFTGIPSRIKAKANLPVIAYDGDLPTSLPQYAGYNAFIFDYYPGADLSEYDAFLSSSKGAIPVLKEMGARNIYPFYYAVDPELYSSVQTEQDIDIFYYGHGDWAKEKRINYMIMEPSKQINKNFLVGGKHQVDLGKAKTCGVLPISQWKLYCCQSKINLNITKEIDAQTHATSSARPFELASMGCCIVTDSYNGIEEWFEVGKEVFMANNENEAKEIYNMLLSSEDLRRKTGEAARQRVLKEHTMNHRAKQLVNLIKMLKGSDL